MYLSILNDNSKEYFLELAYFISLSDGKLSLEEKALLKKYKMECQIPKYKFKGITYDAIENHFVNKSTTIKKVVIFELIGLAYVDGHYSISERDIIEKLNVSFSLNDNTLKNFENQITELNNIYNSIYKGLTT